MGVFQCHLSVKGPVINYRGGGLVQKREGSDIFVHEKRGGQKFLCHINTYLPGMTLLYNKTNK